MFVSGVGGGEGSGKTVAESAGGGGSEASGGRRRVCWGRRGFRGEVRWRREGSMGSGGSTVCSVMKVSASGPGVEARRSDTGW